MKKLWILALPVLFTSLLTGCASKRSLSKAQATNIENPIIFEEEYEAAEKGELPTFDIPVVRNEKVEQWLTYFQGRGRKWMAIWLERSGRYVPFMRKILREHELPEDLVNLAMIESGFSSRAYSRARAVGPWQFMVGTGRLYGLQVNFWLDERRDPEKSTIAAARHLKDLYDQFQSWKLAAAAYNAGAGKVTRAIKKYRTEDFWELSKGRYLRPETRHYVPKMIAAALISKEPSKYGFNDIQFESPLEYDKVITRIPLNLLDLTEQMNISLDVIMTINPELNHPMTPPNVTEYELRVPPGTSDQFLEAINTYSNSEKGAYAAHRVRKGDTLVKIASIYNVNSKDILKMNGLKSAHDVRAGLDLFIPRALDSDLAQYGAKVYKQENYRRKRRASRKDSLRSVYSSANPSNSEGSLKKKVHIVKHGETLSEIAEQYNTTVPRIKKINGIRGGRISPGTRLHIPA